MINGKAKVCSQKCKNKKNTDKHNKIRSENRKLIREADDHLKQELRDIRKLVKLNKKIGKAIDAFEKKLFKKANQLVIYNNETSIKSLEDINNYLANKKR